MDVRFINPFLDGTLEVLKTMAGIDAIPAKPALKLDNSAYGDASGIIGLTGDAVGSLAVSFTEKCICRIVTAMLGERHDEIDAGVIDAVGELTNMISGAARTKLEKQGLRVYAAIPTVVYGPGHRITHILKSPSIVIPFSTAYGSFFADVCIRANEKEERAGVADGVLNVRTEQMAHTRPAQHPPPRRQTAQPPQPPPPPKEDFSRLSPEERFLRAKADGERRLQHLQDRKRECEEKLRELSAELERPFIPPERRRSLKRQADHYQARIKEAMLEIRGVKMILETPMEDFENPQVQRHYQDRPR